MAPAAAPQRTRANTGSLRHACSPPFEKRHTAPPSCAFVRAEAQLLGLAHRRGFSACVNVGAGAAGAVAVGAAPSEDGAGAGAVVPLQWHAQRYPDRHRNTRQTLQAAQ